MSKTSFKSVAFLALLQSAAGHYYFPHLIVNGTKTPEFKYVRDVAPNPDGTYDDPDGYNGKEAPVYGEFDTKYMTDVRCGRDGHKWANTTETASVVAGSEVGFHIKEFKDAEFNNGVFHSGPAQVYMSASEDLATDVGDGDWFKIYYLGPEDDTTWATAGATQINFSIPLTTPPGTYMLRLELPFPIKDWPGHSQWYVNCAHVDIIGAGGGTPGPTIKIPDAYKNEDPGIGFEDGVDFNKGLNNYHPPGPAVWEG
ncbi:lytic polysaccharide monooxygenase [Lentithecium fluviatile CBS 122367]|uniref:lytic cellulose monooxygenase (C4-dehydrogenating) n=1 Tax=Lentithecium fluviatile CBS 122367 TaxID=1168545 RepID=A0A6G1IY03_9PLEO|nr:lytic polysaccharide monooxygenase [Lentithecium fluviatile CBS 122367]